MKFEPKVYRLGNGLRVIHHHIPQSRLLHSGFVVNCGSRKETPENNGVSHLIEHCTFKGTHKRRPYQILNRIENVGGELEAFTTREKTFYFTSTLSRHAERSLDLLSDILFNPVFPENELDKEKKVIREEIDMYEDIPEECLMDDFHQLIFPKHPLGFNILGTRESLNNVQRDDLVEFYRANYCLNNMVAVFVGNLSPRKFSRLMKKYLEPLNIQNGKGGFQKPDPVHPFALERKKDFHQSYCLLGNYAYSRNDEKRYAFSLLNNILGGAGMSSRLNMSLREKYGYVYQIDTSFIPYQDTGLFTIDFSADQENLQPCLDLIFKELKAIRTRKLGKVQLNRAKRQLKAHYAMMQENHGAWMQTLGRNLLDYDMIPDPEKFFEKVDKVSAEDILAVANEVLEAERISQLSYRPAN